MLLSCGIVVVICLIAVGQVRLNQWQGAFYDALAQLDMDGFVAQLGVFAYIVAGLLVLVVAQTWLQAMLKVRLRDAVTRDLADRWLVPRRPYILSLAGEIGVNPDQRMQEDTRRLTELTADLGVGLLQASLLLVGFMGVLWVLSDQVRFHIDGETIAVPGYMVWCALAYAAGGSWLAWRVGRPLVGLNAERYAREAELRVSMVHVNEAAEGIALYGGERDERLALDRPIADVVAMLRRLAGALAQLTWITSGHGWLGIVFPVMVAAPGYFAGTLSFGGLMMVVGAFNQVQAALRWYVDNFAVIADWRATLLRVMTFRQALGELEKLGEDVCRFDVEKGPDAPFVIEDLTVFGTNATVALDTPRLEVLPGERVLIVGRRGAGKSTYFHALAGMWPWGTGRLIIPHRPRIMFLPHRPYMPFGTLRAGLAYPSPPETVGTDEAKAALERIGLERLVGQLERVDRWDRNLSLDDQQKIAFARLLLHRPEFVVHDEALSALDEPSRKLALSIFDDELSGSAMLSIGTNSMGDPFYHRVFHLVHKPDGLGLSERPARPRPCA